RDVPGLRVLPAAAGSAGRVDATRGSEDDVAAREQDERSAAAAAARTLLVARRIERRRREGARDDRVASPASAGSRPGSLELSADECAGARLHRAPEIVRRVVVHERS